MPQQEFFQLIESIGDADLKKNNRVEGFFITLRAKLSIDFQSQPKF